MKKQKGMTLMEIVISMFIYGLLALLVVEIMTSINATMRATDQLNDRLSYEAKYADNFQTRDENGTAFHENPSVTYSVNYNGKKVGGVDRAATEYTIGYDSSKIKGQVVSSITDINYRFMSFEKVKREPSTCPAGPFTVYIRIVPYFTDDETTPATDTEKKSEIIKAEKAMSSFGNLKIKIDSGSTFYGKSVGEVTLPDVDVQTIGLGGEYAIDLTNKAAVPLADTVYNVFSTLYLNVERDTIGDGVKRIWAENDSDIYMYVKVSSSATSATYYNRCVVEFNVNNGQFKPYNSLTESDTLPSLPNYAAIKAAG